ncbi:DUF5819 family protein [Curtobacterium sp. RRHDQ10]|uniref:DUF5819 family protein n=1 Tax=Curtobacterium phyllosphaerae TaxID=3413379 RepID=UPI003BF29604
MSRLKMSLSAAAMLVLVLYVSVALVIAGPVTPISLALSPVAARFEPYLAQSWQLFGPDPVSEERGVLARTSCRGAVTGFRDVTTPSVIKAQSSRLFPSRENRILGNLLVARFAMDDISARLDRNEHASEIPDLAVPRRGEQRRTEVLIARYAASKLPCRDGSVPKSVQVRYVFHSFPGWSERTDPAAVGEVRYFDSRWIEP